MTDCWFVVWVVVFVSGGFLVVVLVICFGVLCNLSVVQSGFGCFWYFCFLGGLRLVVA